ncbi:MAG: sporulation protein YqfD [Hydrogenibacillus sp.]|nr:sporulation protein YqfD [Hydrogenibacillus sp.]
MRRDRWGAYAVIELDASGAPADRFLGEIVSSGIALWNVAVQDGRVRLTVRATDVRRLRRPARAFGVRFRVIKRTGGTFAVLRLLKRPGLIIGFFLFLFMSYMLSNVVWTVEVSGVDGVKAQEAYAAAQKLGLVRGRWAPNLPDLKTLEARFLEQLPWAAWVGVRRDGAIVRIFVVPYKVHESAEPPGPQHLVATKKAVVVDYVVTRGRPLVFRGTLVQPGQLVVSGFVGPPENAKAIAAQGHVYGEVWYDVQVTVPRRQTVVTTEGEKGTQYFLRFGQRRLPVWGFERAPEGARHTSTLRTFTLGGFRLPMALEIVHWQAITEETLELDDAGLLEAALTLAREALRRQGRDVREIRSEKVLQQTVEDDKVLMTIHFGVVEDIARPEPFVPAPEGGSG